MGIAMTSDQVLRISAFEDHCGRAQLRIVVGRDGEPSQEFGFVLRDGHQALDAAEKLRAVGNGMLRFAPRPTRESR